MKSIYFPVLVKFYFILLLLTGITIHGHSQCAAGASVFRETFGGSFSSVDIGPALTNGTSAYTYNGTGTIGVGEYGLRKRTGGMNGWVEGRDNTGQGGYMMMIRSKASAGSFYETTVRDFCKAQSQAICFSAASLSRSGTGRETVIHVEVKNPANNTVLANFISSVLKSNDSISWSSFSFSYPLPNGVSTVHIRFSLSSPSVPDDFAIDEIRVVNVGASSVNGNESGVYPNINGRYEYPVFACLNERVTLSMPGDPPKGKEFQWERMRDDYTYEPVPGANTAVYVIDSAKREDSRFYRLRVADSGYIHSANCSSPSSPTGLYVDPQPIIETNAPICEGTPLDIAVNVGTSVTWSGPNGFASSGKRISVQSARLADSGMYKATVYFNTACLLTVEVNANIVVTKNPIKFYLPKDTTLCEGKSLVLDVTNPGSVYNWSTGDSTGSIVVKKEGVYAVLINNEKNCQQRGATTVHVINAPSISLRSDTTICSGDTLLLTPAAANATKYKWSTGAITPAIAVTNKGIYTVQASNDCGVSSAAVNIGVVRCSEDLLVPAAFTPNKDGLNDVFRPVQDASIRKYSMKIYSRWGQPVFTSNEISHGWDGSINKIPQTVGVYVWVIDYTSKSGKQYSINGTVTLIR
jgi:gliding motility-associated-like protein